MTFTGIKLPEREIVKTTGSPAGGSGEPGGWAVSALFRRACAVGVSEGGEGERLNNRTERGTYPSPAMRHFSILSRKELALHLMNGSARRRREQSYSQGA